MVKVLEDIPQGIFTGIFFISFCFTEILSSLYQRTIFALPEAVNGFFSFQLKDNKHLESIHFTSEPGILGDLG